MAEKKQDGRTVSDGTFIIVAVLLFSLLFAGLIFTPRTPTTPPGGDGCVPIAEIKTGNGIRTDITNRFDPDLTNVAAALANSKPLNKVAGQLCLAK